MIVISLQTFGLFLHLAIVNNAAINVCVQVLVLSTYFHFFGIYLRMELLNHLEKNMYRVSMRLCVHVYMCLYTNTILQVFLLQLLRKHYRNTRSRLFLLKVIILQYMC